MALDIMTALRQGGILKAGGRSNRFYLVVKSDELPVCQSEAKRLVEQQAVRPAGFDSHKNYVFALNSAKKESNA